MAVYLTNVRAVPADLLVNSGTVKANPVSKQFIIALTDCDESFPKVLLFFTGTKIFYRNTFSWICKKTLYQSFLTSLKIFGELSKNAQRVS